MGCKQVKVQPSVLDASQLSEFGRKSESSNRVNGEYPTPVASNISHDNNQDSSPVVSYESRENEQRLSPVISNAFVDNERHSSPVLSNVSCDNNQDSSPVVPYGSRENEQRLSPVIPNATDDNERHSSPVMPYVSIDNEQQSRPTITDESIDLLPLDSEAFSTIVCQQRQIAIDNMTYRKTIDKWRPSSIEKLVTLVQELSSDGNEMDRAWIIFYWMSQNISYDTDAYFGNNIGKQNADNIFQSKKAVCEGYSSLYSELCNRTGIKCRKVSGYAKGFGFSTRQTKFDKTNHAWNIIILDNQHSYFVESTWGSGHLDSSTRQYKQKLVPHYFLCQPEHMIYGHLPENDQDQLLKHPITLKQYLMLPKVHPTFFTLDLCIVSPAYSSKVNLVEDKPYGSVLIQTSNKNVELSGSLKDETGNKIPGGDLVYLDKKDSTLWRCQFAPPKPGTYNILIFAKEKNDEGHFSGAIEYAFDVDHLPSPAISYPHTWSHFFDYNLEIVKPKDSRYVEWPQNDNVSYGEILIRSPDDVSVSTTIQDTSTGVNIEDGTLVNFDREQQLWQCLFAPSNTGVPYEITLFAKRSNETSSHCVVQFDLEPISKDDLKQSVTFPKIYGIFNDKKCHLIEPLNGVFKKNSTVHFRCRIPGAREVSITVDGEWIKNDALKQDENDIYDTDINVGQKEVAVWVKFNQEKTSYSSLMKYNVA